MFIIIETWGPFLECLEKFSHLKSHSKISNLMTTELFYSHGINICRVSLHTRNFRCIHLSLFRYMYRLTKNGFVSAKGFRGFQEMGSWALANKGTFMTCMVKYIKGLSF